MLIYPVISMGPFGHGGSRENLLGKNPTQRQIDALSSEKNVSLQTPPCFLMHGADDAVVPVENTLMFATALSNHKISFEAHILKHAPHGFTLGSSRQPPRLAQSSPRLAKSQPFRELKDPEHTDIVVIGAGAAGIIAAWRAATLGAKVVLLEKTPVSALRY